MAHNMITHAIHTLLIKRHGVVTHDEDSEAEHLNDLSEHFHTMMPLDPAGPPYRPSCGGSKEVGVDYDIKLHLASLLVLLVTSSAAAYAPIYIRYLIKKNARAADARTNDQPHAEDGISIMTGTKGRVTEIASNTFQWALWATKHFGTGVIIGTAFIHILPAAHSYLTAPCLPPFFTTDYPSLPDAIAMAAMFAIFLIDFSSKSWVESLHDQATADTEKNARLSEEYETHANSTDLDRSSYLPEENRPVLVSSYKRASKGAAPINMGAICHDDLLTINQTPPLTESEIAEIANMDAHQAELRYHRQQELLSTLIVEAGTCFHSIFLGLSLALSTGDGFTALFIAIVFHQVFEGLAIGSRLASIDLDNHNSKDWNLWVCSTIYGITTPMGVAIGIAVRQDYDLASERSLILTGVFDSMSAGFLLYGGLVGLLSRDFLHGELSRSPVKVRMAAIFLVSSGMLVMGVLGRYA